jgi:hypothetical protein
MTGFLNNAEPDTAEDRLRAALQARAQDFTASQDAWEQVQARGLAAGRHRSQRSVLARYAIPAAAAAAVIIVIVAATTIVHGMAGSPAGGHPASGPSMAGPTAAPPYTVEPDPRQLATVPPVTGVLSLRLKLYQATGFFWFGYNSPDFWGYQEVSPGLQFCNTVGLMHGSEDYCYPVTALRSAGQATVTAANYVTVRSVTVRSSESLAVYAGSAADQVTSVTAVLPDGRTFAGTIGKARGFPDKAWLLPCPAAQGTRLLFRNGSGQQVASLSTTPLEAPWLQQPRSGGITVLGGTIPAYLTGGRVAFWSRKSTFLAVSPDVAAGKQALAGMADVSIEGTSSQYPVVALGYAHANVARIVVHLPGGKQVTVNTFTPGWPGSSLRLWTAQLGTGLTHDRAGLPTGLPTLTATAYDTAGHVVAQVRLGFTNFPM